MDIQLTTKSQDALGAAVRIAGAKGNPQVEPLHVLDSLLQQGEGIASALLVATGADVPALTGEVRRAIDALPSASGSSVASPQLSNATYKVINDAQELARERGDAYVSTEHLL
ncbi:MAG: Clp protease N-terminal domain-containing protein, partial [Candidatus Nanopelagicales bacterium]